MRLTVRLFTLLTTLALFLTGTIPQGWMPALGEDGEVLLVLCTSEGAVEQWVDLSPDDPLHDDSDERFMCPFAGLTAAVNAPVVGAVLPFAASIYARWAHRDFTHRSAGFYPRYDARGPPHIS